MTPYSQQQRADYSLESEPESRGRQLSDLLLSKVGLKYNNTQTSPTSMFYGGDEKQRLERKRKEEEEFKRFQGMIKEQLERENALALQEYENEMKLNLQKQAIQRQFNEQLMGQSNPMRGGGILDRMNQITQAGGKIRSFSRDPKTGGISFRYDPPKQQNRRIITAPNKARIWSGF